MDLEKYLEDLKDYDIAFEIKQGYYHVSIEYDKDWEIVDPENNCIYVEVRNGVCHYIVAVGSATIDDIFKAINMTINYNLDLQKKLELFKKKTKELQEIFANENIEVLEGLEFKYGEKSKKRGRKLSKKKKILKDEIGKMKNSVEEDEQIQEKEGVSCAEKYDENGEEEIVTMDDSEYMQELERK